jgi:hypothetical protein
MPEILAWISLARKLRTRHIPGPGLTRCVRCRLNHGRDLDFPTTTTTTEMEAHMRLHLGQRTRIRLIMRDPGLLQERIP